MTSEAEFIERSIRMQLGGLTVPIAQSDEAKLYALRASSGTSAAHDPGSDTPEQLVRDAQGERLQANPMIWEWRKTGAALREILSYAPHFGCVVDMQDRRLRNIAPDGTPPYPTFAFNRVTTDTQRVLWPLPIYHDLAGDQFLADVDPNYVAWQDKRPGVVWRGITGGRVSTGTSSTDDSYRLKAILRKLKNGEFDEAEAGALVAKIPRYRAVAETKDDPFFDMGFVDGEGFIIKNTPFHAHLEKPRATRQLMQQYRYIAVLRGLDVGSSFYWTMNSGSVGLVMETAFETFASGHFKPWEHFIPFKADLSDLHANIAWAEANQDACQEMVRKASELCQLLARADLRQQVLGGLIEEMNALPFE